MHVTLSSLVLLVLNSEGFNIHVLVHIFSHTDFVLMLMDPISYASDALKAMAAGTVCNPCVYYCPSKNVDFLQLIKC